MKSEEMKIGKITFKMGKLNINDVDVNTIEAYSNT